MDKKLHVNITIENEIEQANFDAAKKAMESVLETEHAIEGCLMPDTCPTGEFSIPVGGVVSSDRIHPAWHSADVCCSLVATTTTFNRSNASLFSQYRENTHFGVGGRADPIKLPAFLEHDISTNPFTKDFIEVARTHFGTQGDGNHFGLVGNYDNSYSKNIPTLVTHHGSRGFGAAVFKRAMEVAIEHKNKMGYDVRDENAWIPKEMQALYWAALQTVRDWTYHNHYVIHDRAQDGRVGSIIFTPHNFVFVRDNLYYHAKGATPMYDGGTKLIPMNMRDGVLTVRKDPFKALTKESMGFAPHGAGRNLSRMAFRRSGTEVSSGNTKAFFYSGYADVSEMPEAYKSAEKIKGEIEKFDLAYIGSMIKPTHSLMAGLQPWEVKRLKKKGLL